MTRTVAEAVASTLVRLGVEQVFGVVGSGNFHLSNAMVTAGARFVAARHEAGATTMADAYARMSGTVSAVTVHQGCGLTNTMTGMAEAAKSRTPMVVLAADVTEQRSNFFVDQDALGSAVGVVPMRVDDPTDAVLVATEAFRTARDDRRTVLVNLPLQVQAQHAGEHRQPVVAPGRTAVPVENLDALADALAAARRPVFVAGLRLSLRRFARWAERHPGSVVPEG